MNPYATQLGDRSPLEVLANTPGSLVAAAARLGPERLLESLGPGKWSPRDVLCHLADCEIAFGFRLRQAVAEPNHVIQPFDQDHWAKGYHALDADAALDAFAATRRWNLAFIQNLQPEQLRLPVTHPERGTMTVQTIVETMAGHDRNHLAQLEQL